MPNQASNVNLPWKPSDVYLFNSLSLAKWIFGFMHLMNYKRRQVHNFVPDMRSCILGVYDKNVYKMKIINTVMLLVKMYIMNCKYDRGVLSRVAFVQIFMCKVMLLSRLYENDVFVQLAQMFAET